MACRDGFLVYKTYINRAKEFISVQIFIKKEFESFKKIENNWYYFESEYIFVKKYKNNNKPSKVQQKVNK